MNRARFTRVGEGRAPCLPGGRRRRTAGLPATPWCAPSVVGRRRLADCLPGNERVRSMRSTSVKSWQQWTRWTRWIGHFRGTPLSPSSPAFQAHAPRPQRSDNRPTLASRQGVAIVGISRPPHPTEPVADHRNTGGTTAFRSTFPRSAIIPLDVVKLCGLVFVVSQRLPILVVSLLRWRFRGREGCRRLSSLIGIACQICVKPGGGEA